MALYRYTLKLLCICLLGTLNLPKSSADELLVTVQDPFLDVHTGPGRSYPIFHVIEAGEEIEIIKRRTDWFRVKTRDRQVKTGWVHLKQLQRTVNTQGAYITFANSTLEDAVDRRWEWSMSGGDFSGSPVIASAIGFSFTPTLVIQLQASQILSGSSDGYMLVASIRHSPFPHWRISPYFQLGAGILRTEPFSTIVQADDQTNQTLNVGVGGNLYLSRRFIAFIDYRYHTVLTSRDDNKELSEWKLGFSVFF